MTLTASSFSYVRELMLRETGNVYPDNKDYLVAIRLRPLATAAGLELPEYVKSLPTAAHRQQEVVDALTINETQWFRDQRPFSWLSEDFIPALVERREDDPTLRVWSAACSSGQEPYSIVMSALPVLPAGWRVKVTASDISPTMVQRTSEALYTSQEVERGLPEDVRARYMRREGDQWRVSPLVTDCVETRVVNLDRTLPPLPRFDVIFLRNVLIYFDDEAQDRILERVRDFLAPEGALILGQSELARGNWKRSLESNVFVHRPA